MASPSEGEMHINPQRAKQLLDNISQVTRSIKAANKTSREVRLIAVSKLKPPADVLALHTAPNPHLHFGENYLQELQHKATVLPSTIRWHFIGALQTNKCRPLAEIPNLWCVESVDTIKKADQLEKGRRDLCEREEGNELQKKGGLRVFVQVNTSGEEAKSGAEPGDETLELCRHIRDKTQHLKLAGLMTIGAIARSQEGGENEDFVRLQEVRDEVQGKIGGDPLELSMGMSADYETAVQMGSDEVRVGTGIFGERPKREDKAVKGDVEKEKG
ncbi:hypothetical protein MMC17_009275 [Xylographa soralifera]|nr:hypothetical protein [Xylographa soralifera]